MLHIHFGTGRLGLGLIAPSFKTGESELYLLNRATSGDNATGETSLGAERRNHLLRSSQARCYCIERPGGSAADRRTVSYDRFQTYDDQGVAPLIDEIVATSRQAAAGVMVTASILAVENYGPVIKALNLLAQLRGEGRDIGRIYFIACENTLSAPAIFRDQAVAPLISPAAIEHVTCVHALVDRMCVGLEEAADGEEPTVLVRAEEFGSVRLELGPNSENLVNLCRGSEVTFSGHVDTEKQIKSWLLNGTHWLIALEAFEESHGDKDMKLNEFLRADPRRLDFARRAMREMQEGVALLLRSRNEFRQFIKDVDVDRFLQGAATAILDRFCSTEDPITRILARFRAPTPASSDTVVSFTRRFADRVDEPMRAYEAKHGVLPPAACRGVLSLNRLVASRTFIDAVAA